MTAGFFSKMLIFHQKLELFIATVEIQSVRKMINRENFCIFQNFCPTFILTALISLLEYYPAFNFTSSISNIQLYQFLRSVFGTTWTLVK